MEQRFNHESIITQFEGYFIKKLLHKRSGCLCASRGKLWSIKTTRRDINYNSTNNLFSVETAKEGSRVLYCSSTADMGTYNQVGD